MKKTLLALAVAGLATSAFANTNIYTFDNGTSSANLGVFAEARYNFTSQTDKTKQFTTLIDKTKYHNNEGRLRFGLYGSLTDSNKVTYSLYSRFQTKYSYTKAKGLTNAEYLDVTGNRREGVDLNRAYVKVEHPVWGGLLYGKYVSLTDSRFKTDLEYDDNFNLTAIELINSYDSLLTYYAPTFYGVTGALSYGETKTGVDDYTKQIAAQARFDLSGNHVVFTYANQRTRSDKQTVNNFNAYDLAFYNDGLIEKFVLGAAVSYQHNNAPFAGQQYKEDNWSIASKVRYTGFQWVQPFLNVAYDQSKFKPVVNTINNKNKLKSFRVAYGLASDVYKYQSSVVTVYAEGYYKRDKTTVKVTNAVALKTTDKVKGFNVGAKLAF